MSVGRTTLRALDDDKNEKQNISILRKRTTHARRPLKQIQTQPTIYLLDNVDTLLFLGNLTELPHQSVAAVIHQRNHLFHLQSTECWCQRLSDTSPLLSFCSVQHAGKGLWRLHNLLK